ncbi:MAG: met0+ like-family protein [Cyanobacteria bacterium RYN_339]|nr:met0+ like-family protein [Cyanobacteria bacterium RYN_339]
MMLANRPRMDAFKHAIARWVHPGDVVLEAGAGTGILSALAARQGARRVYAAELDPLVAATCRATMALNGLAEIVTVVEGPAEALAAPEPVDVVICEMLHVGLVNEQQLPVLQAVLANLAARQPMSTLRCIPFGAVNAIQLMQVDYGYEGLQIPLIRTANPYGLEDPRLAAVSEPEPYWIVNFLAPEQGVDTAVTLTAVHDAEVNALQLVTKVVLTDDWTHPLNDWYLWTMQLPMPQRRVQAGEQVGVHVAYEAGCDLEQVHLAWI